MFAWIFIGFFESKFWMNEPTEREKNTERFEQRSSRLVWVIKIPLDISFRLTNVKMKDANFFAWWFVIKKLVIGYYVAIPGQMGYDEQKKNKQREKKWKYSEKSSKVDRWCNEIKRIYLPANCDFKGRQILGFYLPPSFSLFFSLAFPFLFRMRWRLASQGADETNETQNNLNKIIAFPLRCFVVVDLFNLFYFHRHWIFTKTE